MRRCRGVVLYQWIMYVTILLQSLLFLVESVQVESRSGHNHSLVVYSLTKQMR